MCEEIKNRTEQYIYVNVMVAHVVIHIYYCGEVYVYKVCVLM